MLNQPNSLVNPFPRLVWTGASRTTYEFEHHAIGMRFNAIGGVYIFCKQASDTLWYAIYVGETDNFSRRLSDELAAHHRWDDISRSGATHVCAMVVRGGNAERVRIEN
ncbi:hypothetical protein SAMN05444581_101167 [Methylocapsa palsarum]|uniref:GIY-YIG domain-containing protein n=1 Tax=Methylocapsa palsarum TaxID=1612308 RepID=A0A1I3VW50_9HYPH|nr:hypothetical protein SAMN05444581_101167 [Methylocapsa palsarum]